MTKATVASLKDVLLETLEDQIRNGVVTTNRDGEAITVSAGAPVLAVAAKFVKDWADEIERDGKEAERLESLQQFLNRKRPDIAGAKPN